MTDEKQEAPALPGEVLRGEWNGRPVCVTDGGIAWEWDAVRKQWHAYGASQSAILLRLALHERARADGLQESIDRVTRSTFEAVRVAAEIPAEHRKERDALRAVVDALPKCESGTVVHAAPPVATMRNWQQSVVQCDACARQFADRPEDIVDLPYAGALRALPAKAVP